MRRIAVVFDGFNFYYGLRKLRQSTGTCLYWQDLPALAQCIAEARSGHAASDEIVSILYFTADIKNADHRKRSRQQLYFQLLAAQGVVQLCKGEYSVKKIRCAACGDEPASCANCNAILEKPQEKQTDVNLAIWSVLNAAYNEYDDLIIISSDNDLQPVAKTVRMLQDKRVCFCFPPMQNQLFPLKHAATDWCEITKTMLESCLMRWTVEFNGRKFRCPEPWRQGF